MWCTPQVLLGFAASFRHGTWVKGRAFDVRFAVNRSLFNKLQVGAVLWQAVVGCGAHAEIG